jgi:NAD+ synthase (glutamine-hydrolysing)
MRTLRLGLAQINTTVGALKENRTKISEGITHAKRLGVDLLAFPEMTITGYPPEDLLLHPSFIDANLETLHKIVPLTRGISAIVGFADRDKDVHNAAAVICDGKIVALVHKSYLPNYGVFDENRYFQPASACSVFKRGDVSFGVSICEDIWSADGPVKAQALWGDAQLLINISASPYSRGKGLERERMLATRAVDNVAIVAFCNLVGGQDELVFDGHSLIIDERGEIIARAKQFEEDLLIADINFERVFQRRLRDPRRRKEKSRLKGDPQAASINTIQTPRLLSPSQRRTKSTDASIFGKLEPTLDPIAEMYQALVLGTRDYSRKNGFEKALIGLSGGVDSALVACIAVDGLGPEHVMGVFMPSRYSSDDSRGDAQELAENLGIELLTLPIDEIFATSLQVLKPCFKEERNGLVEENLQARIRALLWMALSNQFGWLVLTTGNKSELSVGYTTLYGDMAGGFCVLKDVYKTRVYELARYRNKCTKIIPPRILERAPTAELRLNQTDEADLPAPYIELDKILELYIGEDRSLDEIVRAGHAKTIVRKVLTLVDRSEYKRRQGPIGIKITSKAFGRDRRWPITNKFRA